MMSHVKISKTKKEEILFRGEEKVKVRACYNKNFCHCRAFATDKMFESSTRGSHNSFLGYDLGHKF